MWHVRGTTGYSDDIQRSIRTSLTIDFYKLHKPFVPLIPRRQSHVLDVGAGIGRDALVFAEMGHDVVAVEPNTECLVAAKKLHGSPNIRWVEDSLPTLSKLDEHRDQFDFVLVSAVWHHLEVAKRHGAMGRLSALLKPGGVLALSLRHGPAGVGTHVFPTNGRRTVEIANSCGLKALFNLPNQPSLLPDKHEVTWTRLAFVAAT